MYYTRASLFLGIALAAALFATPTAAIEFVGKVVGVTDGDTVRVQGRLACRTRYDSMTAGVPIPTF